MKCLIIAAGKGSRLSKRSDVKPLVPILGLALIERIILAAKRSGLDDFYVVTGYCGEKIRAFLDRVKEKRNIKIAYITNEEWEKENGLSVLAAKYQLNEHFILLMGDHLFDENIIRKIKDIQIENDEVMLAVDYNTNSNPFVDIADVTKVLIDGGKVIDIGKNIKKYNAYDTGIFLCSPAIFKAIETSVAHNDDSSLSGAIKVLAEKGRVRTFDIGDASWIDVDDEGAFQKAERCLIDKIKKSSDGPIFSSPLNRFIDEYREY